MPRPFFWLVAGGVLLGPAAAEPAPVPKGAKPPVECHITLDPKADPFAEKSLTVRLKNNTDQPIELRSNLPFGVLTFLDVEIENPDGKRVSAEFHYLMISSPFADAGRCGELPANGALALDLTAFASVPGDEQKGLKPGKYRVRVTFRYDKYTAVSDWAALELKAGK